MKTLRISTAIAKGTPPKGYPYDTQVKTVRCKLLDGTSTIAVFEGIHAQQQAEEAKRLYEAGSPLLPKLMTVAEDGIAAVQRRGMEGHPVLL
jgi:hypothetical protein